MPPKPFKDGIDSERGKLVQRLAARYGVSYEEAYYYCDAIDFLIDALMGLGADVTIDGILDFKTDVKKVENMDQIFQNKLFLRRVLYSKERFYFCKTLRSKQIISK